MWSFYIIRSNRKSIDTGLIMQKSLIAKQLDIENEVDIEKAKCCEFECSYKLSVLSFVIAVCYLNFVNLS